MYNILVVEDDLAIATNIMKNLAGWNYNTYKIDNFENVLEEFLASKAHLVIMDVNLPFYDGFFWCKKIRGISKTPIIFLSSRDSNMDFIMAVSQGADDYVTKPFSFDLLLVKIQALLRRTYDYQNEVSDRIEHKGVILDVISGTLYYQDREIELTKNEQRILGLLLKNKSKVISRDKLMKTLWNDDCFVNENTLTVNINRVRSKLEDIGIENFITTRKGEGYIIL